MCLRVLRHESGASGAVGSAAWADTIRYDMMRAGHGATAALCVAPLQDRVSHSHYLYAECSHCHGHGRAYAPPDWPAPRNLRSQAGSGSDEEFILFLRLSQAVQGPPTATVAACKRHVPLYFREPGRQQRAHALPCRNRPWPTSSSLSPSFPSFVSFLSKQLRVPLAPHTHTHSLSSLLPP
jgi:hypothetical protein